MQISIDIETVCAYTGCEAPKTCDHALNPFYNEISIIGLYWKYEDGSEDSLTVRNVEALKEFLSQIPNYTLTGFNLKWDLQTIEEKGFKIPLEKWTDDAQLMSTALTLKMTDEYLEDYEKLRVIKNLDLPKGFKHRRGLKHSLKTLAPFFLGMEPFWEDPTNHDSVEYVLKDAKYTYLLTEKLRGLLKEEESHEFYSEKLLPWTKLLYKMERRGVSLDLPLMDRLEAEAKVKAHEIKLQLDDIWRPAYVRYRDLQLNEFLLEINNKKEQKEKKALEIVERFLLKAKTDRAKQKADTDWKARAQKIRDWYSTTIIEKESIIPLGMNLGSPSQLAWIFKEYLKLDIKDFDGDETTGKMVLQKLAGQGHKDVKLFLDYREQSKLITSFFPSYREKAINGIIHAKFNPDIARTGRLTSSKPNLQQVPSELHGIFKARQGYKIITKDESAIEPRLIAFYSNDPTIYTILQSGLDFHGYNTKIFFDLAEPVEAIKKKYPLEREVGKEVGLAILYGAGKYRLQESAQKRGFSWSTKQCQYKVEKFKESYEGVYKYKEKLDAALLDGPIKNISGRAIHIPDPKDIYMKGFNSLIQSSASDVVWNSAERAQNSFESMGIDAHVLLLVHDEVVVEAKEEEAKKAESILDNCMTDYEFKNNLGKIELKVEGKVADRWEK